MAITVTNINSMSLLNILNRTSASQSNSMTKLSTGLRINSGKDDPAGLIAMRGLETELTAVDAALASNQRTDAMLKVADSALVEVSSLLTEIQQLAQSTANDAGLSAAEKSANQAQIDNAVEAIDRIINTTEFNGKKLLDGSLSIDKSGVDSSKIDDVQLFSRNTKAGSTTVEVSVDTAAEKATLAVASAAVTSDTSISIKGKDGAAVIDVTSSDALADIVSKIDAATAMTGVDAVLSSGTVYLQSSDYGEDGFVRANVLEGDTTNFISEGNDSGKDAAVTINGQSAAVDGLNVNFTQNGLSMSFNLSSSFGTTAGGSESFTVSNSGGATFQLGTDSSTRYTMGIDGLYSQRLGSSDKGYLSSLKSGGSNSLLSDPNKAAQIAAAASSQVAKAQGRIGGFQKFQVETAVNSLNVTRTSLEAARSSIADVDYATETAELNKQNVLLQSAMSLLGVANQQSSQVLSLLM